MLGTSMVIGDGVLTPCISDRIVWTSVVILVTLFMVQRFGTDKLGYTFAPIIFLWFSFFAGVGVFNFIKYDTSVIKSLNPVYIVDYFIRNKEQAWISLGGTLLSITGTVALFADVGHFSVRPIRISMCCLTYPALVLASTGQASFHRKNNHLVANTFYESIPGKMYWPMFVVAVAASVIASQAMISATFSIIQQSLSLGCFPRVKIVHTSNKYPGQVYIPEVNYLLMFACICVTLGFRTTAKIGNAYGITVVLVMALTSTFLVLVMIMIWKTNIVFIILYILIIGSVELLYMSSVLYKFDQGGYLPLAFAMIHVHMELRLHFELDHKISPESVREIVGEELPASPWASSVLLGAGPRHPAHIQALRGQRPGPALVPRVRVVQIPAECRRRRGSCSRGCSRRSFRCSDAWTWRSGVVHMVGEHEVAALWKRVVIDYGYNFLKKNLRQSNRVFAIPHKRMLKVGMTYHL
ncbi:hypothetical protein SASPL_107224 [Salvia splendens]|uniref:K+ potassium transporter integral membrane domain-containing protein n=1 Tax=Salvia splendens TaxID=180675 RepID=A0A8X8Y9Z1_SALSN|nr:hypothetical protein SASPL_107224 [Salvia splendens]